MAVPSTSTDSLRRRVGSIRWYHTLELAPGVVTPGWFDTREVAKELPFPPSLAGQRCLDVGTFNGFWAFEMERRGAEEVVAIDLTDPEAWEWPAGSAEAVKQTIADRMGDASGFDIAREALGSSVQRLEWSVYDLDREALGEFDFIYLGSLLLHLKDPVGALEHVRDVCRGRLLVVDTIDLPLTVLTRNRPAASLDALGRPWWWKPTDAGLVRMIEAAGFRTLGTPRRLWMPPGRDLDSPPLTPRTLLSSAGRHQLMLARKGDPHAVVLAEAT